MANRFDNSRGPPSKRGRMDGGFGGGGGGGFGGGYGGPHGGGGGHGQASLNPQQVEQELMRVDNSIRPNHIILMTVLNAMYPINVNIIHHLSNGFTDIPNAVII